MRQRRTQSVDDVRGLRIGAAHQTLIVADEVVPSEQRAKLYQFFKRLPFTLTNADRFDTQQYRHLGYQFPAEEHPEEHPVIAFFVRTAAQLLAAEGQSPGRLKRADVNLTLYGDIQFAHVDGDEWTVVAFVNDTWHDDWGGELLVYDSSGFAYAVAPRPGRIAIFDGQLLHRGGVPSRLCSEPRITLALKFARHS